MLVQLIDQFLALLSETQQASVINNAQSTLTLVENAIRELTDLAVALAIANSKAEAAKVVNRLNRTH